MKPYKSLFVILLLTMSIVGCGGNGGVEPAVDTAVPAPATAPVSDPVTPINSPPVSAPTTTTVSTTAAMAPVTIIEPLVNATDPTDDAEDVAADTLAPTVSVTVPLSASTDVALNQTVSATFSETMDIVTITTTTFTMTGPGTTPVTGEVIYDLASNVATFTPTTALIYNTLYTVTIHTGAKDLAGNALASDYGWSFLTIPRDYTAWIDQGILYTALIGDAYYPSAVYDANGFGVGDPSYALWYSNGINAMYRITSSDGLNWGLPIAMIGLAGKANHAQVLYDALCFGATPCDAATAKYRMWFWDITAPLYNISAMATANSADGIIWTTLTSLTQDSLAQLVTGAGVGWNRGSYGPVSLFFSAIASNLGSDPWGYSYVMYYDGTSGGQESTGLAYSADGLFWHASASNPVLAPAGGVAWDANYATIGTVLRDSLGLHYWYSGGVAASSEGIGYAFAADGDIFTKIAAPIFHISDGISYRAGRVYTPSVIDDGSGTLKMYYSARATSGQKKIGMAVSAP